MISQLKGAVGIVHSINAEAYTAKVKLPEYNNEITEDLTILSPITFGNKITTLPKINTPVLCVFMGDKTEHGFILGAYFSEKNKSLSKEDEMKIYFKNSEMLIKEDGNIEITAELTKVNGDLHVTGKVGVDKDVEVSKSVTATAGVYTQGISLSKGVMDVNTINYGELNKK